MAIQHVGHGYTERGSWLYSTWVHVGQFSDAEDGDVKYCCYYDDDDDDDDE